MEKKTKIILGLIAVVGAVSLFLYNSSEKKSSVCGCEKTSNFKSKKKDREGIKKCDCTYTGKAQSKPCSKSVSCKDCCEGGGLGDVI